jgi:ATP-dependent exoDNAse (exonuclease V) beta subunit
MTLADREARDRIANDLQTTFVVEAAAGTGKTTALVGRILALLVRGAARLSRIVAVTFTEKAAGEMKLRLRAEIERVRTDEKTTTEQRARLDAALEELEAARMSTIHGFCADILRERAIEAGVDPLFEVADDRAGRRLFREAFEPWFAEMLKVKKEGVQRVLRRRSRGRFQQGPRKDLLSAAIALAETRDFDGAWERPPFDRKREIDAAIEKLRELGDLYERAAEPESWLGQNIGHVQRFLVDLDRRESVSGARDYDGLESQLADLLSHKSWKWRGGSTFFAPGLPKAAVLTRRDETYVFVHGVLARCEADLAACLREELRDVVAAYEREKARAGKLDFFDLLLRTRDLLRDSDAVRRELQERYTHVLVDEFQDTDPLQAEIVLLLTADDPNERDPMKVRPVPGKLFVVGDPKQSIYRFRRADVALYEAIKQRLLERGAVLLHLTTSFRAVPSLQRFVNDAFEGAMIPNAEGTQAAYVPLHPYRQEITDQPTLIALPVPKPYSTLSGKISQYAVNECTPDAVAAMVDWILRKSTWRVSERDKPERVPVESRHICLLFKRFQMMGEDLTRPYVRALEARRIAHVLLGGRSFHEREEVIALRAALSAIEWPDDELSVYATLRGPFLAIGDDALLVWRNAFRTIHPMIKVDESQITPELRPVQAALGLLARLHKTRNRRPIADTIAQFLEETRAHAGIAIWPTGEQALANILRMMDMARSFEAEPATSFRSFVQWLDEEAEEGEVADAPVVEEGTEGVRMLTIHRAKGLEFPIVILVDPGANPHPSRPSRYVDPQKKVWAMPLAGCAPKDLLDREMQVLAADHAESVRLLYVATTRARDLLIIPAVADEALEGKWLEPLYPVIYPKSSKRDDSKQAPGCPAMKGDTCLDRPPSALAVPIRAGLHEAKKGGHAIVWWDLKHLELDKQEDAGLRQQRILAADEGSLFAGEGERTHAEWKARIVEARARGAAPSFKIESVTRAAIAPVAPSGVRLEATSASREKRPHGKRFGSLVHAILATVPLDASRGAVETHARTQARMFSANDREVAAAIDAVHAALEHPLLRRARRASNVRRESPIALVEGDLRVEGVLDLAFFEADAWTVIDFKTDAEIEGEARLRYERQVALYVLAVQRATGQAASGVLLAV